MGQYRNIYGKAFGEDKDMWFTALKATVHDDEEECDVTYNMVHQVISLGDHSLIENLIAFDVDFCDGTILGADTAINSRGWDGSDLDIAVRELAVRVYGDYADNKRKWELENEVEIEFIDDLAFPEGQAMYYYRKNEA